MKVKLQGHDYELKALKEGLNKVTNNDIKFSFLEGRKIELTLKDSEGKKHKISVKFNEILKALNSADTTMQLSHESQDLSKVRENVENIENILTDLDRVKDMGHENKSLRQTFYNLFRRSLPNFTREKNLNTLRETKNIYNSFDQPLLTQKLNFTKKIPGNLLPPDKGELEETPYAHVLNFDRSEASNSNKGALAHVLNFDQPQEARRDIKPITYEEISNLPHEQRAPHLHQHLFDLSHEIQNKMLSKERQPGTPPFNLKEIHAIIYDTNQLITRLGNEDPQVKKQLLELLRSSDESPVLQIVQAALLYLHGNDSDKKESLIRSNPDITGVLVMHLLPTKNNRKEALEHCNLSSVLKWVESNKPKVPEGEKKILYFDPVATVTPYVATLESIYRETPEGDKQKYFGNLQIENSSLSLDDKASLRFRKN